MKRHAVLLSILVFLGIALLSERIITNSRTNQHHKQDYAELNHIKYGLFSINKWKEKLSGIVADEIDKFEITNKNERKIKQQLEGQLAVLIDNINKRIRESNKGSASGWLKQSFIDALVDIDEIKKGIPKYADSIMKEASKEKNQENIREIVKDRVDQYLDSTFEEQDVTTMMAILKRAGTDNPEVAKGIVSGRMNDMRRVIANQAWVLILSAALLFAIVGFSRKTMGPSQFIILLLSLLCLLAAGVSTPMIDMEAKISEMSFYLLGHPVRFENQILYFQSKSILDVFWIMVTHPDFQMKAVGILVVLFSIVFPLAKMFCSLAFYYDFMRARSRKWVQFFVLKSGKWSMTDVQIVAIFMAYVGFNGIITSQFGNLKSINKDVVVLTTNGTALQPGFFMFLAYTILALFLSGFLTRELEAEALEPKKQPQPEPAKTPGESPSPPMPPSTPPSRPRPIYPNPLAGH